MIVVTIIFAIGFQISKYSELVVPESNYVTATIDEYSKAISSKSADTVASRGNSLYYSVDNVMYEVQDATLDMSFMATLNGYDVKRFQLEKNSGGSLNLSAIFLAACLSFILFSFIRSFGKSNKSMEMTTMTSNKLDLSDDKLAVNTSRPNVTFDDVCGCAGIKDTVQTYIECLKNPDKLRKLGGRMPKGLILYGPPGTGKTLIAKAIAGSANVNFIGVCGSGFTEMYVGVGPKRIRELYQKAKANAPCIVFIDEIDAIGAKRSESNNSEDNKTIIQLLNELDGFSGSEGVFTIAATNRIDLLDSALVRPGRFDLKLAVPLPTKDDRYEILLHHATNKLFEDNVDMHTVSSKTIGFAGADLESLLNESALCAVARGADKISNVDIDEAMFKIIMKGNKAKHRRGKDENLLVAFHEAGHALASKLLTSDGVPSVTIIESTSGAGGVTFRAPQETTVNSKSYLRNTIKTFYAGRAAERILLKTDDEITTGAACDIREASKIIKHYLGTYGMGNLGLLATSEFGPVSSEKFVAEATELSKTLYSEVEVLLNKNYSALEAIATALVEFETLDENQLDDIIKTHVTIA